MNNMANHLAPTLPHANGPKNIIISDYALPRFYIVRPDKSFVPLIPADEIDPMWRIKGIPAQLSPELIQQWNMARCGDEVDPQRHTYQLEQIYVEGSDEESYQTSVNTGMSLQSPDTASTIPQGKNMGNMEEAYTINRHVSGDDIHHGHGRGEQLSQAQQQTQNAVRHMMQENDWNKKNDSSRTKDAATPGIFGKKKYCTYWIRTGNCDYIQEGCRYLHVIPDEETRLKIGIRDMPRWAKEDLPVPQYGPERKYQQKPGMMSPDWRNAIFGQAQTQTRAQAHAPARTQAQPPATVRGPSNQSHISSAAIQTPQTSTGTQNTVFTPPFLRYGPHASQQQTPSNGNFTTIQAPFHRSMNNQPNTKILTPDTSAATQAYQHQLRTGMAVDQRGPAGNLAQSMPDTSNIFSSQPPISRPAVTTGGTVNTQPGQTGELNKNVVAPDTHQRMTPERMSIWGQAQSQAASPGLFPQTNPFPATTRQNKAPTDARVSHVNTPKTIMPRPNSGRINTFVPNHQSNGSGSGSGGSGRASGNTTAQNKGHVKAKVGGPIYLNSPPSSPNTMAHVRRFTAPGEPKYVANPVEEEEDGKPIVQPAKQQSAKPHGHRHGGAKTKGRGKNSYDLIDATN